MSRETENVVLLLVGLSIAIISVTGAYTRYVKPALLPWLACTALLLIALALIAMVRDIRHGRRHHTDSAAHSHRSGIAWLLIVPIALLAFVVPPAIRPQATTPSVVDVSADDHRHRVHDEGGRTDRPRQGGDHLLCGRRATGPHPCQRTRGPDAAPAPRRCVDRGRGHSSSGTA